MTLDKLERALNSSWSKETAYHADREKWSEKNNAAGQCTVTAIIIYDYFGGKIYRGYSKKYDAYHYWNKVNGEIIDLTIKQFPSDVDFQRVTEKRKEDILKIRNVKTRYMILKEKVDRYLNT